MSITLSRTGSVFAATAAFEDKDTLKAAGLRWHGGNCRPNCPACAAEVGKQWWTPDLAIAARLVEFADETARDALAPVVEAVASSRAQDAEIDLPLPVGVTPYPFQRAGIAYGLQHESVLFGDAMGLGKTIQSIVTCVADPSVHTVLVTVPASLRINWEREINRFSARPNTVFQVSNAAELAAVPTNPEGDGILWVVTNYDRLVGVHGKAFFAALMVREWDALIADEAHNLRNPEAQRTQAVLGKPATKKDEAKPGLKDRARRKLFLTGTPLVNRPIELWSLIHALDPVTFPSFFGYAKRYCNAQQTRYGWDFTGSSHLDELQQKLRANLMVRRLKEDVLTELPAKVRQVLVLPANGASGAVQAEADAFSAWEEKLETLRWEMDAAHAAGDPASYAAAVAKLQQGMQAAFTEMSRLRREVAVAKVPYVLDHVKETLDNGDGKIIVFAHHHEVISQLCAGLAEYGVVSLTGETPMTERQLNVDAFQTRDNVRVFVASILAAGVGITLTAASEVVFAELDWVPGNVTQAEDRAHRIGQRNTVFVQHLVLDGSLDARMALILVQKQAVADKALDLETALPGPLPVNTREPIMPRGRQDEEPRPETYPVPSDEVRAAALQAMQIIRGRCDGVQAQDGMGFSGATARVGWSLAERVTLTDGQTWLACKIARIHRGQLPASICDMLGLEVKAPKAKKAKAA